MAEVGKSGGEGTFAGTRGNDEDAPTPAVRGSQQSPRDFDPLPTFAPEFYIATLDREPAPAYYDRQSWGRTGAADDL
jgi:hypothetical protein